MSVSVHIEAVIPHDGDLFTKFRAIFDACGAADVELPEEVAAFFMDENRGEPMVYDDGKRVSLYSHPAATGKVMEGDGAVVDLSKLPMGTAFIRVSTSC